LGFVVWKLEFPDMLPNELISRLEGEIEAAESPREMAINVMFAVQNYYGYLSDEGLEQAAELLRMTPLELEELATFYDFIYREPVGKFVIHICDGVVCWMNGYPAVLQYLFRKLGIRPGETTGDGLFTILPTACIGYCDLSPAVLVNGRPYGPLTPEKIDELVEKFRGDVERAKVV
jgi:NADH-quinone oxidoreductase subunit E